MRCPLCGGNLRAETMICWSCNNRVTYSTHRSGPPQPFAPLSDAEKKVNGWLAEPLYWLLGLLVEPLLGLLKLLVW